LERNLRGKVKCEGVVVGSEEDSRKGTMRNDASFSITDSLSRLVLIKSERPNYIEA
jgi:hypothetical protein